MYKLMRLAKLNRCQQFRLGCFQQNHRQIFTREHLGITEYKQRRNGVAVRYNSIETAFKKSIQLYIKTVDQQSVCMYTLLSDFKDLIHLVDNTDSDIDLLIQVLRRVIKTDQDVYDPDKQYNFGPIIMRVFHYYQLADVAIECYDDPELRDIFNNVTSYQILLDLLYKQQRYHEVIRIFKEFQGNEHSKGYQSSKYVSIFAIASCYQLNTPESFEYVCDLIKQQNVQMRRADIFAAGLAVNQNAADKSLRIIENLSHQNDKCIRNIKIIAYAQLCRFNDVLSILRPILEVSNKNKSENTHVFSKKVITEVDKEVSKSKDKALISEFNRIIKQLNTLENIVDETLDSMVCSAFTTKTKAIHISDQLKASFESNNRSKMKTFKRPGLKDL